MLIRVLKTYLAPYKKYLLCILGLQILSVGAVLYIPALNADIIDRGVTQGDQSYIVGVGGLMLLVSLGQAVASITSVWFASRSAMGFGRDIRRDIYAKVGSFGAYEVGRFTAPSLITRATNDVQQVQMLAYMACSMAVTIPITMVGAVAMAVFEGPKLAWIFAVIIPILFAAVSVIIVGGMKHFRGLQTRLDEVNRVMREQITGIRVIRAFVRERAEEKRFGTANNDLTDVSLKAGRWMATFFPLMMVIVSIAQVAVIWFGGHLVDDGEMMVGPLTAFLSYLMQVMMSVMMGTFVLMQLPRASVCAERISEVLDTEPQVKLAVDGVRSSPLRSLVEFDDVSFAYPGADEPVLCEISLRAEVGQTIAVIGSTGSGKTTLVNLVPRLFDVTSGVVKVDGVDVREWDGVALGTRLGLVPQKAFLFSGTIRSNLEVGRSDATETEMWQALEIAQARDFVASLEEGLDAPVVQGGGNFSGGQRQRLAIARALIRKPEVYLFDDSFSALDLSTDARLRAALKPETRDACVIIVAQRVSTIRDADQILVLDAGRIVGRGTHTELLAGCATYQEIVASQMSAEEAR